MCLFCWFKLHASASAFFFDYIFFEGKFLLEFEGCDASRSICSLKIASNNVVCESGLVQRYVSRM